MLNLQDITYIHPDREVLFSDINLTIPRAGNFALIGNNGAGKSTLLKIMAGILLPSSGKVISDAVPYYVPQIFGQFDHLNIAAALQIEEKLIALKNILDGNVTDVNLNQLNEDWTIEERCHHALRYWHLEDLDLFQEIGSLSGGQKTRILLAGIFIHQPEIILLDEPTNHLDKSGRKLLFDFIRSASATIILVSHDRELLQLTDTVYELSGKGISIYGGNYEFYAAQKKIEFDALAEDLRDKEKALRKARETERETAERQQKLDARGKKKQENAGLPTISMNTFRNNAEKTSSRLKAIHAEKTGSIANELKQLRQEIPAADKMNFGFDNAGLHNRKVLVNAMNINFGYYGDLLWENPLTFQIVSGERIVIAGSNGSGKTTLVRIILGEINPTVGTVYRAESKSVYIDQDYSLIDNRLNVYEQADKFNTSSLLEHEIKIRLNRFLFTKEDWDKSCSALSGGERMRLMLCCITISNHAPDLIILDEPTNNLDMQNIEILTAAIRQYNGTLLVISHDQYFLKDINAGRIIELE